MKKVLKVIGGFVAVVAATCVLSGSAQARPFISVNLGLPLPVPLFFGPVFHSTDNCYPRQYSEPRYCYERPVYYHSYCGPSYYHGGGSYYRCR